MDCELTKQNHGFLHDSFYIKLLSSFFFLGGGGL